MTPVLFCRWESRGSQRAGSLSKVTWLAQGRARLFQRLTFSEVTSASEVITCSVISFEATGSEVIIPEVTSSEVTRARPGTGGCGDAVWARSQAPGRRSWAQPLHLIGPAFALIFQACPAAFPLMINCWEIPKCHSCAAALLPKAPNSLLRQDGGWNQMVWVWILVFCLETSTRARFLSTLSAVLRNPRTRKRGYYGLHLNSMKEPGQAFALAVYTPFEGLELLGTSNFFFFQIF